jgi:fibronectin type 3 domain-containing protein
MKGPIKQSVILPVVLVGALSGLLTRAAWPNPYRTHPHSVTLNWHPPAPAPGERVTGYNVYRGTKPGGPYEIIASRVPKTNYVDRNVESKKTYYYVVTCVDQAGRESKYSVEIRATVP